jgi:hypothetical protein
MAVRRVVRRSQRISIEEESTEGTPVAETANGAMLVSGEGAQIILDRDWLQANMMSGSFTTPTGVPGMWGDNIGAVLPTKLRGIGTLGAYGPDWQMPMKSGLGSELAATSGTIDTGATAISIPVKTGGGSLQAGMLLYFPTQGEVRRVSAYSSPTITLDVPLSAIPSEDDDFKCGRQWLPTSDPDHPIFTLYAYFGASWDMRCRFTSCKTSQIKLSATNGGYCDMEFTCIALEPTYDYTAQAVTPNYDDTTPYLTCLNMQGWQRMAGTITGVPTTTETVLLAPNFDVRKGQDYIQVDTGSGVWETKLISDISGDAPGNLTISHAELSGAGTATETAYILRSGCADFGSELELTIDTPVAAKECMYQTYGKAGLVSMDRNITITRTPYFESWEQFLMRDNAVGMSIMSIFGNISGDDQNNIVAVWIGKAVNTAVSINNDDLMTNSVTSMACKDAVLGNDFEIVIAAF